MATEPPAKKAKTTDPREDNQAFNYINGEFVEGSGGWMDILNPATGKPCGQVTLSTKEDVDNAIAFAAEGFAKWSRWTVKERMKPLLKLRHLIEENEDHLAAVVVMEHGKTTAEALGSTRKGNETVEYACGMPTLLGNSQKFLEVSNGVECKEFRLPVGVCGSIVPFNFPIMVPLWSMPICIATGNCQILKPSEKVPLTAYNLAKLVDQCGFPAGVFQVVNGTVAPVQALCDNPTVKAVTFVGSTKIAKLVYNRCKASDPPKRCLALGGAKNHMVAVSDCNVKMTSGDVVNSSMGSAGQRCMAAPNLVIVGENQPLVDAICKICAAGTPGHGKRQVGPVIDQASLERITKYINDAEKNGGEILVDGRKWTETMKEGFWVGPTVIRFKDTTDPAFNDEIFGPVLSIVEVPDNETAIKIENANPYGNAACIYTSSGETAQWFYKRFSAGMIGVNIGVPVPREPFSFGGINASKVGDTDITGSDGISFFTYRKKVTTKWRPSERKTWMD